MEERVQKILAQAGIGSRRACEKLITAGRVRVNGKVITLGDKADPAKDTIELDSRKIQIRNEFEYFALYKPRGILSSAANEGGRKTVIDLVPASTRIFPVGRLDIESEGLIILTSDGELANLLTHPRYEHEKEYRVLVARHPDQKQLDTWQRGVVLEDGYRTKPVKVWVEKFHGDGAWLRVIMTEGRKRQIRETASQIGLPIVKLIRVRMSSVTLGNLKSGQFRPLTDKEIQEIKRSS
ncbi:rRNA pseudouridine synthase [bacterium]|nr:rRNA pseudouridine synthase [bacterium]